MDAIFDLSSFIIQTINLLIIAFVLRTFFFRPYLAFLDKEREQRRMLEESLKNSEKIVEDARIESKKIIDEAKSEAKTLSIQILETAKSEAKSMNEKAQSEVNLMKTQALSELYNERNALERELQARVLDVALKLNEKLFTSSEANQDFLKKQASNIQF